MEGCMDGWMDDGRMIGWVGDEKDGWIAGWMERGRDV
jgi:hypothetical protein